MESVWAFGGYQVPREEAGAVLIPVAYDLTTTYGTGARHGPRAMLDASTHLELFDEELGFAPTERVGVHTIEVVEQVASGPEAMVLAVADLVGGVLDEGKLPILFGGEHSLTIGSFLAMKERGLPVSILQLDAHADLREEFQGTPYSHACVMARGRERFPCVQIGIRSISAPEHERVMLQRLPLFPARRLHEDLPEVVAEAGRLLGGTIYLTIDLDVLDPSIFPSTGTPEPGGLLWDEILAVVRSLTRNRQVVGFDLMEHAPIPGMHAPDFLAAKLLNKVLGYCRPAGA
jgi:agmatinase